MTPTTEELLQQIKELETWNSQVEQRSSDVLLANERLDLSLSAGNLAWWEMNVVTGTVDANEHKPRMLGYDPENFALCHYSKYTELIHPDDYPAAMEAMRKHMYGECPFYESEYRIRRIDGSYLWFYDRGAATRRDESGRPLMIKGVVLDVTERKTYQLKLEQALREKEFLIQEIHHRVKNNLNLICMVIYFMQTTLSDEKSVGSFKDLSSRIQTMALLHQFLYQGENSSSFDLGEYLGELVDVLVKSLGEGPHILMEKRLEPIIFNHDHGVKVGLIVNEVLTNSLKYAFLTGKGGTIRIELSKKDDLIELQIANNGPAIDVDKWNASKSLGHNLVAGFISDLKGSMKIENHPHPIFIFTFPLVE